MDQAINSERTLIHRFSVRIFHWLNVIAMLIMIPSGWQIYNATVFWNEDYPFPNAITLGGWLGGGIKWHLAGMWLLVINLLVYFIIGIWNGHFKRRFFPWSPRGVVGDLTKAVQFKLPHDHVKYNYVQKTTYIGIMLIIIVTILSGFELWKPVQLQFLGYFMGGYEGARRVHFIGMALICAFIVLHLALVAIVPSTFLPMITGYFRKKNSHEKDVQNAG
jgi:thiosulfate reductase cytochrome b subunit